MLAALLPRVEVILGSQFTGLNLEGSLARSDFDIDSYIAFVVVTEAEISNEQFLACIITRFRLDAALYEPAPLPKAGQGIEHNEIEPQKHQGHEGKTFENPWCRCLMSG